MVEAERIIDVVFDGPPDEPGKFVEVEEGGKSINLGSWIQDGEFWHLRFSMPSTSLNALQDETAAWRDKNFPGSTGWQQLLGVVEEVGELSHAYLKKSQGIRGTADEHDAKVKDAVGDIAIFLMGFCTIEGLSFLECIELAWNEVKSRDWTERPVTG